jgi:hypothetical protein
MRRFSNYRYVSLIPIEGIRKIICNPDINKAILEVEFLLSGETELV